MSFTTSTTFTASTASTASTAPDNYSRPSYFKPSFARNRSTPFIVIIVINNCSMKSTEYMKGAAWGFA